MSKDSSLGVKLTQTTGNTVDFTRIASLLQEQNHRYTFREIIPRVFIGAATVVIAAVGFGRACNDEDQSATNYISSGLIYGVAGFVVSRTLVILPLIIKRCYKKAEIEESKSKVKNVLLLGHDEMQFPRIKKIELVMETISNMSLEKNGKANASQTLGCQARLMENLRVAVEDVNNWKFFDREVKDIIQDLCDMKPNAKVDYPESAKVIQETDKGQARD